MIAANEPTPFHLRHHVGKVAAMALRLAFAENALHSLTSGQVDAIIGPGGKTYLLRPAQEHLRQNERRLQAVLDSIADVVTVVSRAGVILSENQAVLRVFGYAPEELIGSKIFQLVHDADLAVAYSTFIAVIEGHEEQAAVRFRHLTRDGSYRLVEANMSRLQEDSTPGVVFSLRPTAGHPGRPAPAKAAPRPVVLPGDGGLPDEERSLTVLPPPNSGEQ